MRVGYSSQLLVITTSGIHVAIQGAPAPRRNPLRKPLGSLKAIAFVAYPVKRPSGKMPLLISLHGGGGKAKSVTEQLTRSAQLKGLRLAELAGKELILLEPNSSASWNTPSYH